VEDECRISEHHEIMLADSEMQVVLVAQVLDALHTRRMSPETVARSFERR